MYTALRFLLAIVSEEIEIAAVEKELARKVKENVVRIRRTTSLRKE